jgi:hypothetical protein
MVMSKEKIRTMNGAGWPHHGQTQDQGIGSRVRALIADMKFDESTEKQVRATYDKVVKLISGLPQDVQRLVCLAAGSDFTLDSLIVKGKSPRWIAPITLGPRDQKRIAAVKTAKGDAAAKQFEEMLILGKVATKRTTPTTASEAIAAVNASARATKSHAAESAARFNAAEVAAV